NGIRDLHVTGVQTCALPIFIPRKSPQEIIGIDAPLGVPSVFPVVGGIAYAKIGCSGGGNKEMLFDDQGIGIAGIRPQFKKADGLKVSGRIINKRIWNQVALLMRQAAVHLGAKKESACGFFLPFILEKSCPVRKFPMVEHILN